MRSVALLKLLDRLLGPPLLWLARLPFPRRDTGHRTPGAGHRVLVIRPGGLGDAVVLMPSLRALRDAFPDARIDILCEPRNRAVFDMAALPGTRVLLYTSRPLTLPLRLRRARYDAVFDTEQSHHFSALFAAWTRAPVRVGFDTVPARSRLYTHAVPYDLHGPEGRQFAALFAAVAAKKAANASDQRPEASDQSPVISDQRPVASDQSPVISDQRPVASDQSPVTSDQWPVTSDQGGAVGAAPRPSPGTIVLHLGGSNPSKHWPEERYAALCDALATRAPGLRLVLLGGKADRAAALRAAALCHTARPDVLAGTLALPETAALCASARLFVGPDSGIAHLAETAGTYSVVLFGSGDPAKWGPASGRGRAVVAPAGACDRAPCAQFGTLHRRRGCRYECVASIPVEAVLDVIPKEILP